MKDLIRKILKEQEDEWSWVEDLTEISPEKYFLIQKFKECELFVFDDTSRWTQYFDNNGDLLFLDNIKISHSPRLYVNYNKIWVKLVEFGLNNDQIEQLCIDTLYETLNRRVLTVYYRHQM